MTQPGSGFQVPDDLHGPSAQPRSIRWVTTLTYLQFAGTIMTTLYTLLLSDRFSNDPDNGLAIGYTGVLGSIAIATLFSAALQSRRQGWVRKLSIGVQSSLLAAIPFAIVVALNSGIAVQVLLAGHCLGAAVTAAVNLWLLLAPASRGWYR